MQLRACHSLSAQGLSPATPGQPGWGAERGARLLQSLGVTVGEAEGQARVQRSHSRPSVRKPPSPDASAHTKPKSQWTSAEAAVTLQQVPLMVCGRCWEGTPPAQEGKPAGRWELC
jgi:hypothetical protein